MGKDETSSPTASLAGLLMTCVINAYKNRDVATLDIPGAFLQAKQPDGDKDVHVMLDRRITELLAKISLDTYGDYVHQRRGQSHIYCCLNVALYGTLKAALLFWQKLSDSLKTRGFNINPYDWCIANRNIKGSQYTIVWHVDDLKISHASPKVVDQLVDSLRDEYGKIGEMSVNRGKLHDYLGMTLDFSSPGKFTLDMEKYIEEIMKHVPDDMHGMASTPAGDHLFKTRDEVNKLSQDKADQFHRIRRSYCFYPRGGDQT